MTADASSSRAHFIMPVAGLAVVVVAFVAVHFFRGEKPASPLQRGVAWLAAQQQPDGSWRGKEIAVLRPGPAMTAFVLYAMTRSSQPRYAESLDRAARYLESQINAEGIVGMTAEGPDYPNYATSLTVLSFVALKKQDSVGRMVDYLRRAQLDEGEGWTTSDPEYGGWAFGGPPQPKPYAHRLDISMTRFALEALAAAAVLADDPVWSKARKFLQTCQQKDGGFIFTPLTAQNKAGEGVSYGSATADGILSFGCAGGPNHAYEAAETWIRTNFTTERCPGFPPDHPRPWADGLFGYWLASASRIVDRTKVRDIVRVLTARQRPDGSWVSSSDLMLENEPLLATALAVLALTEANRRLLYSES